MKNICKYHISSEMVGPENGASVYMCMGLSDDLSEALPRTELLIIIIQIFSITHKGETLEISAINETGLSIS